MSEYLDRIEQYMKGKMSSSEAKKFEDDLANDPDLNSAYERYNVADHALELAVEEHLKQQLEVWSEGNKETKPTIRRLWLRRLAVAASVLLLATATLWLFNRDQMPSGEFTALHFERFDQELTRSQAVPNSLYDGFTLFENGQIQPAIDFFESVADTAENNYAVQFVLGDLYYQRGDISLAKDRMEAIVDAGSLFWIEKAQLNYLLLCLESAWTDKAEKILNTILADESHPYYNEARKIKSRVNQ